MLFDAKEFEHFFTGPVLKNGLTLFERGQVMAMAVFANGTWEFSVGADFRLNLQKRGDKILSYQCSCNKKAACEHLSAVLFYFQKEVLGLVVKKNRGRILKKKTSDTSTNQSFRMLLNGVPHADLLDFIELYAAGDRAFKDSAGDYFSSNVNDKTLYYFQLRIRILVKNHPDSLNQDQLNGIYAQIKELINKTGSRKEEAINLYYLHLAVIGELPAVLNRRITGNESQLVELVYQSRKALDLFFKEGLSTTWKTAWLKTTRQLTTLHGMGMESLLFLIPRALNLLKHKYDFEDLIASVNKYKSGPRFSDQPDHLLIVKLQLAIKGVLLFKTPLPPKQQQASLEWIIAKAELDLCNQKIAKGFKQLEKGYDLVKENYPMFRLNFINYFILKAAEYDQVTLELKYLIENMLYGLHIQPKQLRRLLDLLPADARNSQLDALLNSFRNSEIPFSEEKIMTLLLTSGRLKQLTEELKKHPGKFPLLHRLMVQDLPDYTPTVFPLYADQFLQALETKKETKERENLVALTKRYLERLPEDVEAVLVSKILDLVKKSHGLSTFLNARFGGIKKRPPKLG